MSSPTPPPRRSTRAAVVAVVALLATTGGLACRNPDDGIALSEVSAAERARIDGTGEQARLITVENTPPPTRPTVEIPADWPSEIEAVYGRYWLYWDAFTAAHGPPWADPGFAPLQELSTPDNWASLEAQLQSFADDGLVLELPDGSISEHRIRLPEEVALTGAEGEEVVLQDCWIDDLVQRTVDGATVAEAREAKLMNVVMRVVDGEWRVDGVTRASAESDGVEQCAELIN